MIYLKNVEAVLSQYMIFATASNIPKARVVIALHALNTNSGDIVKQLNDCSLSQRNVFIAAVISTHDIVKIMAIFNTVDISYQDYTFFTYALTNFDFTKDKEFIVIKYFEDIIPLNTIIDNLQYYLIKLADRCDDKQIELFKYIFYKYSYTINTNFLFALLLLSDSIGCFVLFFLQEKPKLSAVVMFYFFIVILY
ncbi:hypothetical protein EON71_01260, partial [bacterium]